MRNSQFRHIHKHFLLTIKNTDDVDVDTPVGVYCWRLIAEFWRLTADGCLLSAAESAFDGLRSKENFGRLHVRQKAATEVAEIVLGLESPRRRIVIRGAAFDMSDLLLHHSKCLLYGLFSIAEVSAEREIISHLQFTMYNVQWAFVRRLTSESWWLTAES